MCLFYFTSIELYKQTRDLYYASTILPSRYITVSSPKEVRVFEFPSNIYIRMNGFVCGTVQNVTVSRANGIPSACEHGVLMLCSDYDNHLYTIFDRVVCGYNDDGMLEYRSPSDDYPANFPNPKHFVVYRVSLSYSDLLGVDIYFTELKMNIR
jgi:hypothetical protein